MITKPGKVIDEQYLAEIREESCIVCHKSPVDPDHIQARQWRESNRNDYFVLPLCRDCHTERGTMGDTRFQEKWQINLWQEIAKRLAPMVADLKKRMALTLVK